MDKWLTLTLIVLLGLSVGFGVANARQVEDTLDPVNIRQLARGLVNGPPQLRREFALLAIAELVSIYEKEAGLAVNKRRRRLVDRDSRRWSSAVRLQAAELAEIASGMTDSTSVQVGMTPYEQMFVIVDGRLVILSNPRIDEQTIFEQRVASRFCEHIVCADLPGVTGRMATARAATSSTPRWSFSDQAGPVCNTEGGLEIQFTSIADLRWKRTACAAVLGEVLSLAERIALERANGTQLDGNAIVIQPYAEGDLNKVLLNERGDFLLLRLPALSAVPEFFRLVLPWLIARSGGVNYGLVVVNGERVLAPLSQPVH